MHVPVLTRAFISIVGLFVMVVMTMPATAEVIHDFIEDKKAFIDFNSAKPSKGADVHNNVILFIDHESEADLTIQNDYQGYLYARVRSGEDGEGIEYIIPGIAYHFHINGEFVDMRPIEAPSRLLMMVGKYGTYGGWIVSKEPVTLKKGDTLNIKSWVDWGILYNLAVTPEKAPEPVRIPAPGPERSAEQVLIGQSEKPEENIDNSPDKYFEEHFGFFLAPKDITSDSNAEQDHNMLVLPDENTWASWIIPDEVKGYLYVKVRSGTGGSPMKYVDKDDIEYIVEIDGVKVPMSVVKAESEPSDDRYETNYPTAWIRSQQMIDLNPGSRVSITSKIKRGELYVVVFNENRLALKP